jgi:hypothetical protein
VLQNTNSTFQCCWPNLRRFYGRRKYVPGTKDELKPGALVSVFRPEKAPDGSLQTARINVGIGNMLFFMKQRQIGSLLLSQTRPTRTTVTLATLRRTNGLSTQTGTPPLLFAPKIMACSGGAPVASRSIRLKTTSSSRGFRMELWFT